jgi:hypothetical protein
MGCCYSQPEPKLEKITFMQYTFEHQFEVYAALIKDDYKSLKPFIECGFLINLPMKSFKNRTPLHLAAEHGSVDCLNLLVSSGANVNARDPFKITPLMLAVQKDSRDCVRILLKAGAKTRGKNSFDESIIDYIPDTDREFLRKILSVKD